MLFYKGLPSQDAKYNDSFIGHLLDMNRTFLLKKEFKKNKSDIEDYYTYKCIKMIKVDAAECGITTDCLVLRSESKLPKSIMPYQALFIDRRKMSKLNTNSLSALSIIKRPFYYIYNDYVFIINTYIENIIIKMMPEQVEDDSDVEDNVCDCHTEYNYIPVHLTPILYEMTLKLLLSTMNLPVDNKNNRNDETINVR